MTIPSAMANAGTGAGYPITAVPFNDVAVDDVFWSVRMDVNRNITIPHAFQQCEETGRLRNFALAESVLTGAMKSATFCSRYGFDDSDVFKVIEGAAYALHVHPDSALHASLDTLIAAIGAAQEPDGYLYTMRTIDPAKSWASERWVNDRVRASHELYNVGHLYEAAVAHHAATGKRSLLDVAVKSADLLCRTFGPDKLRTVPGHQGIEIGLVKLYRLLGDRKYLDLARFFLDERGRGASLGETYNQDHRPVIEQREAVGHAVRACYMYAGMADVGALVGDSSYIQAIDRIWEDVVGGKIYLTAGIGAVGRYEGFGPPSVLPNLTAYCETCAAIALALWSHRMFLLHGDAQYMDILERVLFNGFLAGVSMSGDRFFYPNPLESFTGNTRTPWFACACCPPNVTRFIPSIPGFAYAHRGDSVYVNLFLGGTASVRMAGNAVRVTQTGNYPWDGAVRMTIEPERPGRFTLLVRIPGWARNRPVPSDLYRYVDEVDSSPSVNVNGTAVPLRIDRGYWAIGRTWKGGDVVDVSLPMPARRVAAHPNVEDDRGRVALERGPVVYCIEWPDNPGGHVMDLVLPDTSHVTSEHRTDLLGGVTILHSTASSVRRTLSGGTTVLGPQKVTAIPYYAWAHRGKGQMTVWPAREPSAARPLPAPTIARTSKVAASGGRDAEAVTDQLDPTSSQDRSIPSVSWWPAKGTKEWVEYVFAEEQRVTGVEVYWFDDTGEGECRVPASWQILFRKGEQWHPVKNAAAYGVETDRYNRVTFDPIEATGLRLEIQLRGEFSAGIYEWRVF